jgi:hypothetical protein
MVSETKNPDIKGSKKTLYNAQNSHVAAEVEKDTDGFKKGGRAKKAAGGCGVMSSAAKGKRPARAAGGGVFSSAAQGTPRGKASHY